MAESDSKYNPSHILLLLIIVVAIALFVITVKDKMGSSGGMSLSGIDGSSEDNLIIDMVDEPETIA